MLYVCAAGGERTLSRFNQAIVYGSPSRKWVCVLWAHLNYDGDELRVQSVLQQNMRWMGIFFAVRNSTRCMKHHALLHELVRYDVIMEGFP